MDNYCFGDALAVVGWGNFFRNIWTVLLRVLHLYYTNTKTMHTIETVKAKLATNQKWVERAIVVLYEHQTADEQQQDSTIEANGVGFNAFDAPTLSYYAEWLLKGNHLTGKHLQKAFKAVPKYAKQILSIINTPTHA